MQKRTPEEKRNQTPKITRHDNSHREGDSQGHREMEGPTADNPPQGPTGTWAQAEGGKGGRTDAGHSSVSRHTARGEEAISGS